MSHISVSASSFEDRRRCLFFFRRRLASAIRTASMASMRVMTLAPISSPIEPPMSPESDVHKPTLLSILHEISPYIYFVSFTYGSVTHTQSYTHARTHARTQALTHIHTRRPLQLGVVSPGQRVEDKIKCLQHKMILVVFTTKYNK